MLFDSLDASFSERKYFYAMLFRLSKFCAYFEGEVPKYYFKFLGKCVFSNNRFRCIALKA